MAAQSKPAHRYLLTHCVSTVFLQVANVCCVHFKGSAVSYVAIRNQHMQSAIEDRCAICGSLLQLVPSQYEPTAPSYGTCFCSQRRAVEFRENVAPILVDFIYGPDYYGYVSMKVPIGALGQRNILVRVVDESLYPPEWKQFTRWKQDYGLHHIAPHMIVEDE